MRVLAQRLARAQGLHGSSGDTKHQEGS
jgi:hypothetical protein